MASVQFMRRRPDPLSSYSVRSEHDLVIRDEANFSATQTLNEYKSSLLQLDPGRAKDYLRDRDQLRNNEARELNKDNRTRKDKMEYILTGTSCIKGKKGLDLIIGLLQWLGSPSYAELANEMQLAYSKRMEQMGPMEPEQPVYHFQQPAADQKVRSRQPDNCDSVVQESEVAVSKLKIIVLGDHNVGKTSFIIRYCTGRFSTSETKPRISDEWMPKRVHHKGACYELQFWDTHGMEQHSTVPSVYYRDAVGLILVYDISQPKSQESVKRWWGDASATVMMKDGQPLPTVLVANKSDLQAATPDGTQLCEQLHLGNWYKTSAKNGKGLNEAVECLVEKIIGAGLLEDSTECWTEIPENVTVVGHHIEPETPVNRNTKTCSC